MRCPGQDPQYWTGEVAFEVSCPKCDATVEFFKDESSRRCSTCGHRFRNPRASFDCAQWCAFAGECLGYNADRFTTPDPGQGPIAARLIRAIKDELEADPQRIARAMMIFQHANELLAKEGGDPRLVLSSAMLIDLATDDATAQRILESIDLDDDTIACVLRILDAHKTERELDSIEFQIATDANTLVSLGPALLRNDPTELDSILTTQLKTTTAKDRVKRGTGSEPNQD